MLGGRAPVGLPVRLDRALEVPFADPRGGHVAPGRIRRRRLAQLDGRLPGTQRGLVVIESIARLAKAQQGGGGKCGVVEPDDPAVANGCIAEVPGRQPRVGIGQEGDRLLAGQPPGP